MAGNIACHIFGCSDTVVGQCKGYNDACGRFFCKAHSPENLCLHCYDEMWKAALEAIRYTKPQTYNNNNNNNINSDSNPNRLLIFNAPSSAGRILSLYRNGPH